MQELLTVTENSNHQQVVSARELHRALELTTRFSKWVSQNFDEFVQNEDFSPVTAVTQQNQHGGTKAIQDYALTIGMAKELCLMSHTELGKTYRRYFIELERKWNDPAEIVKRGYAILQDENAQLKIENSKMKPKALFADAVAASSTTILIGDLAKILRGNGVSIGQNRLFQLLRDKHYLISRKGVSYNMPTQSAMDLGLFEIKETAITHSDGHVTINKTPKVTGKGQGYFINLFLERLPQSVDKSKA
ncbi:phage antirepressor KilAC domain-containing protein [Loigolactobacillus bifermentans]|uniref:Bacteriophage antirepressor n=1 Tax=Loigolactobacillus bifermentans DSM 20003 TaxID=1423726 RepID=A0A0R1H2P6_9LACO|nr:phage antirepressor KilAC domain-containing protein [Loigolactobacillus bifermentans]KRK40829.1 bacteriophage antirepressor [Loigolactobacillus bifermentans DSM 20003]QGG59583.1 oxidoreductase [Loigolactobacillus bifermentans]